MKLLSLFFLLLCLIEIYGQRIRTSNTNQDVSTQEPKTPRGRGRSRFSATEELSPSSERPTSNRRASTRTRIQSNNPKPTVDRRARPTTETSKGYAVDEVNNDSPIESFVRQSKPRVLTESRFEIPVTASRRSQNFQPARNSPSPLAINEYERQDLGFGSTARAILQARGEPLPVKTTTPVIDEAYLINNFGSTIRSLAAARYEVPIQRATHLRSEVPILNYEDIPSRRASLRGDPLPSLRGSDISAERQPSSRSRPRGQARTTEKARASPRGESRRKTIEALPGLEMDRPEPETEAPETVQGLFEMSESLTETQPLEGSSELPVLEEEVEEDDLRKTSSAEVVTQKITEPPATPAPRRTGNIRRNGSRGRAEAISEYHPTSGPRARASRTRPPQGSVEIYTVASTRTRGARKNDDDAAVAESRTRGPSVFTAEQYQDVTSRSRTGRRIDSRSESVPERITVDLTSASTGRIRNSSRRATTVGTTSTERSLRDRSNSRVRSRSKASPEESTFAPVSRSSNTRRPSSIEDTAFYGDKTRNRADIVQTIGRRESSVRLDTTEPRATINKGSPAEIPRRVPTSRPEPIKTRSRSSAVETRRQGASRAESVEPRNLVSSRSSHNRHTIPDEAVFYGEKSSKTRINSPETTTTTSEEPTTILNVRSKSRFPEVPPKIDEAKLEVLPLFEREVKPLPSARSRGQRSRSSINRRPNLSHDHMDVSATENDVKFIEKPTTKAFTRVTVTRTESLDSSTSRTRLSTRTSSTTASTSTTDTTRRPSSTTKTTTSEPSKTTKKWVTKSPPLIRESVVAEVNQVTSKSTITRTKKVPKAKYAEMLARRAKNIGKNTSSDEITEEDNYPEPFKALIQAKKKEESRPSQSSDSVRGAISSTNTEKVFVTSAAPSKTSLRGSSAARVVTTESPSSSKRPQLVKEIINDNDNELDPKPTVTSTTPNTPTRPARSRLLPKFSEKPKYTPKPREKYKSNTDKPKFTTEKTATKSTPKKSYSPSTKPYSTRDPTEHHSRRKALRSTASPPSTTPMNVVNREAKYSAKFIRKETKGLESNNLGRPKSSSYSKRGNGKEDTEEESKNGRNASVTQTPKPSLPIKKFNASRYSSRYRSDPSQRSTVLRSTTIAPFYIPTIPTPAYIPTVPTIAPSVTPVGGYVAQKDKDLGLEVISFDDPVNTIHSADLVNGEYLTTDKNIRLSPMVKDGTTEKPVSIIERIINSLTSISTTAAPNITTATISSPPTSIEATENSAILKLAPKKPTTKDKTIPDVQTNIIETITSEKPTTIIEKIRSSLSAIQSNEVGTSDLNIVSSSSTTPLSTVTKYSAKFRGSSVGTTALPAPQHLSTSINPLSVFDEIDENQILEKRTIGKLLNILNGLVSTNLPETPEKLVVVTPKSISNSGNSPGGFVATTFSSQEPLEAIDLNGIEPRAGFIDPVMFSSVSSVPSSFVNTETTSFGSTVNTESATLSSVVNTETSNIGTETMPMEITEFSTISIRNNTEFTTLPTLTNSFNTDTLIPEIIEASTSIPTQIDSTTQSFTTFSTSNPNALSINLPNTSTDTSQESTTTLNSEATTSSDTISTTSLSQATTNVDGLSSSILYTFPSTLPTIPNIEVSPGSVSIFSANDLSNFITSDDNLFNTVTIASRVGFDNNVLTSTTSGTTTDGATSTAVDVATGTETATAFATTEVSDMTTMVPSVTTTESTTTSTPTAVDTTILSTTVSGETRMLTTSSNTSNSNSSANLPIVSNRSGRILSSDIGDPIGNSIEFSTPSTTTSTTPDYFIFAILNNNTILRKRPPTIPNKDTPFIIVGLYPNNTIIRKFPNGTLIPMEQIIKVRGFDTRPNPPPLVEITSNQVTDTTNGMTLDNNSVTVESNRMARLLENESVASFPPKIAISTTNSPPLSTTSSTTTNEPKVMSTTNNSPDMSSTTLISSTSTSETSVPSTTTSGTTMTFTSTLPSSTTSQGTSTTMSSNVVEIMAIPGETRISKPQTSTAEPSTDSTSTVQSSTSQASTSTIAQSTETISPTLGELLKGEILNRNTVNALASLLSKAEVSTTNTPNFKTLDVNQNSITSTTTVQSTTTELSTEQAAPFTSPMLSTESTTQFPSSNDRLLSSTLISTLMPTSSESTTQKITITSTTPSQTTSEIKTTTQKPETTTQRLTTTATPQVKTTQRVTTGFPTFVPSTLLPTILSTLFPNLLGNAVTTPSSPLSTTRKLFTSNEFSNTIGNGFEVLSTAGSTARPTSVLPETSTSQRISTTNPTTTTTTRQTTTQTTTETVTTTTTERPTTTRKPIPTTAKASKVGTPTPSTKQETDALFEQLKTSGKLKNLNEEQRKNLEEIEKIEKEQVELLKQLTALTKMFGGQAGKLPNLPPLPNNNPLGGSGNSLANRVISMAMERDRAARSSTENPPTTTTTAKKATKPTTKRPNSIQDQLPVSQTEDVTQRTTPSLEDVLKQYNLNGLSTPVPLTATYGKTDEALLAAILKEQGIGPTTPKILADKVKESGIFEETPTTKPPRSKPKPTTTTARPVGGRLMQGLNWLLDILDPPTTKKPVPRKAKAKSPKQNSGDEELLTNQPTRITPMVTAAPVTRPSLSQEEIQILIKQLEAAQNDPNAAEQLDFSKIKHLQNLINVNEGVQVTSAGQHGATSRATPRPKKITSTTERDPFLTEINKKPRSSTVATLSVSNSIDDDVELIPSTVRTRVLPPVSLNPIPGIDNQGDSLIRSNLLTAAVNVTRAISGFLGSALQDAAFQVRNMFTSGNNPLTNISGGASLASIPSLSGGPSPK